MGCFTADAPAGQNYAAQTSATLQAQMNLQPSELAAQSEFAPLWQNIQMSDLEKELMGSTGGTSNYNYDTTAEYAGWYDGQGNLVSRSGAGANVPGATYHGKNTMFQSTRTLTSPATQGLLSLYQNQISPTLSKIQSQQRASDIADVANLGPAALAALKAYNPQVSALLDTATNQAQQRLDTNGALDPFTKRMLQQDVRGGQAARGMGTGVNDAAEEAYYQDATRNQRQQQNMAQAQSVAAQSGAYYGDPFMQILGRSSGAQPSMGVVQQAGGMTPGNLFNPESPYAGNLFNANQQMGEMFPGMSTLQQINAVAGTTQNVGGAVGGLAGMMGMI